MEVTNTAAALAGDNGANATSTEVVLDSASSSVAKAPSTWYTGADELTTGYIQNKGWSNPLEAIKSYQNLEKLMGADRAGNTIILPKADAAPEERSAFYDKLGRPADQSGYKIDIPEAIGDKEFASHAGAWFHELGLSKSQGEALATKWNEYVGSRHTQQQQMGEQSYSQDNEKLTQEWGAAYTQNLASAKAAANGLGLDSSVIDKLQASLGHYGTMSLLAKIGSKTTESEFMSSSSSSSFGNAMTPAQAKAEIKQLMEDKAFNGKYLNGDKDARDRMSKLHAYAYPGD